MITGIREFLSTKRVGINSIASINPLKKLLGKRGFYMSPLFSMLKINIIPKKVFNLVMIYGTI